MSGGPTFCGLTSGGLTSGGLTSGGLTSGGLTSGGLTSGGLTSGGLTSGGLTSGGLTSGGLTSGGLTSGGLTSGGLTSGGLTSGGLTSGGLTSGGLTSGGLTSGGLTSGGLTSGGLTCRLWSQMSAGRRCRAANTPARFTSTDGGLRVATGPLSTCTRSASRPRTSQTATCTPPPTTAATRTASRRVLGASRRVQTTCGTTATCRSAVSGGRPAVGVVRHRRPSSSMSSVLSLSSVSSAIIRRRPQMSVFRCYRSLFAVLRYVVGCHCRMGKGRSTRYCPFGHHPSGYCLLGYCVLD